MVASAASRQRAQRARRAREKFAVHLARFQTAPFLFVGAGFSRRYLEAPDWQELLRSVASKTGRDHEYYVTSGDGSFPAIASAIAADFHQVWWDDAEFEQQRIAFASSLKTHEGPFKVAVASMLGAATSFPTSGIRGRELTQLRRAVVDGLITTNFDGALEALFPDFRVFIGQDQLLFSDPQRVGEIYKIHGSWTEPESLIITAHDFSVARERSPYLAAMLLTLFVEHPIIFVGYSLSDDDIHAILVSIAKVLTTTNLSRLADRLIFVRVSDDVASVDFVPTSIAPSNLCYSCWSLTVPNLISVYETLASIKRKFPARLLRQLKEHVYRLALENQPHSELFVHDIDEPTLPAGVEVVIGVGVSDRLASRGYVGLTRRDLLIDSLSCIHA